MKSEEILLLLKESFNGIRFMEVSRHSKLSTMLRYKFLRGGVAVLLATFNLSAQLISTTIFKMNQQIFVYSKAQKHSKQQTVGLTSKTYDIHNH